MSDAIAEMKATFRDSFMQPECFIGADIECDLMQSGMDVEGGKYYCRLSASGFLDCTDWHGPFDSVNDCATYLVETYAE